jgi:hypothetical protein
MRVLGMLLLLAAAVRAQDPDRAQERVRALLDREEFPAALERAEAALRQHADHKGLLYQRAQARRGIARDLQRAQGYAAAIDYLERDLSHAVLAVAYAEACKWGGAELRGIDGLRRSTLPLELRLYPELDLLAQLRRYDEIASRAREAGDPEWERWALELAGLRRNLVERAGRGKLVAFAAGAALLMLALLLATKLAPQPPPPASPRARA